LALLKGQMATLIQDAVALGWGEERRGRGGGGLRAKMIAQK